MYIPQSAGTRYRAVKEYNEVADQINFHKFAITDVKRRLGPTCSYLSHLVKKVKKDDGTIDAVYFIAHIIVKGQKRVVRVATDMESHDLVAENYKALLKQLSDYVTGKEDI
jgi:hypothetical protein